MNDILTIQTTEAFNQAMGVASARHPLLEVINLADSEIPKSAEKQRIVSSFYMITIKTKSNTPFRYGRKWCDFSKGTLIATAPDQFFAVEKAHCKGELEGKSLYFHPNFLLGHALHTEIQSYGFFGYDIHEALHLSNQEQQSLMEIIEKVEAELSKNIDDFSHNILIANISLLLSYIDRYFHRQFITRQAVHLEVVSKVKHKINQYFDNNQQLSTKLPSVGFIAKQLNTSPDYLSDLLKQETGMSTQELIHNMIIERAKQQLLNSNDHVTQIAFNLGFEYQHYFSRLFKQKTGFTPSEFRKLH